MQDIVSAAREFAIKAHGEQKRKYTGEPYWHHLEEVAELVARSSYEGCEEAQVVSWLHDVLEDTDVGFFKVADYFGEIVADEVCELSDMLKLKDGNRAFRKAKYCEQIAKANPLVQTVKLADLISNTGTIVKHDPRFTKVYLVEKAALLKVLGKGCPVLFKKATELLESKRKETGDE